jgi:hypothetical protein
MLRRLACVLSAAVLLVSLSGCAPSPEPTPTATLAVPDPTPSPTPSEAPASAPESAFDLPCDDVLHEMIGLFGTPAAPVLEHLWVQESPNWYPGPAQYMFQRAGGVICSYDDGEVAWQVTAIPGAQAALDDLAAEGYDDHDQSSYCADASCTIIVREGDALLEARVLAPELGESDLDRVRDVVAVLATRAAETATEVDIVPSAIHEATCEQLLAPGSVTELWSVPAKIDDDFGGWGIPASVYWNRDGARACIYNEIPGSYEGEQYLTLTTLPAGRWASELPTGRSAVDVAGADGAYAGVDEYDRSFVDVVVGEDWVRVSASDRAAEELTPVAAVVARNMAALGS